MTNSKQNVGDRQRQRNKYDQTDYSRILSGQEYPLHLQWPILEIFEIEIVSVLCNNMHALFVMSNKLEYRQAMI